MDEALKHLGENKFGYFLALIMGGIALFYKWKSWKRADLKEETEAERDARLTQLRGKVEERRIEREAKHDSDKVKNDEETRMLAQYRDFMREREKRQQTDMDRMEKRVESLSKRLDTSESNETDCLIRAARLEEQNKNQQWSIEVLQSEVRELRAAMTGHGIECPPSPMAGSGRHKPLTPGSPDGTDRRHDDDPEYQGPERRQPK